MRDFQNIFLPIRILCRTEDKFMRACWYLIIIWSSTINAYIGVPLRRGSCAFIIYYHLLVDCLLLCTFPAFCLRASILHVHARCTHICGRRDAYVYARCTHICGRRDAYVYDRCTHICGRRDAQARVTGRTSASDETYIDQTYEAYIY